MLKFGEIDVIHCTNPIALPNLQRNTDSFLLCWFRQPTYATQQKVNFDFQILDQ